jgi:hypothetical protein
MKTERSSILSPGQAETAGLGPHVLSKRERELLDNLIGEALMDTKLCDRLVTRRDPTLLSSIGLSEETQSWLMGIQASSLNDFAQAIVAATQINYVNAAARAAASPPTPPSSKSPYLR